MFVSFCRFITIFLFMSLCWIMYLMLSGQVKFNTQHQFFFDGKGRPTEYVGKDRRSQDPNRRPSHSLSIGRGR